MREVAKIAWIVVLAAATAFLVFWFERDIVPTLTIFIAVIAFFGGYSKLVELTKPKPKLVVRKKSHGVTNPAAEIETSHFTFIVKNEGNATATKPIIKYALCKEGAVIDSRAYPVMHNEETIIPPGMEYETSFSSYYFEGNATIYIEVSCDEGHWKYEFNL